MQQQFYIKFQYDSITSTIRCSCESEKFTQQGV